METFNWLLFISLFYTTVGLSLILSPEVLKGALNEIPHNKAATLNLGLVSTILGAAIVSTHFKWENPGEIFVSFVGIAALVKGFIYTAYPQTIEPYKRWFTEDNRIQALGFVCLFLGIGILTVLYNV